jgi:hypothetical protein
LPRPGAYRSAVPKGTTFGRDVTPQGLRYACRFDQTTLLEAVVTENRVVKICSPEVAPYEGSAAKIRFGKIAALKRHVYEPGSAQIRTRKVHVVQVKVAKRSCDKALLFAARENRYRPFSAA